MAAMLNDRQKQAVELWLAALEAKATADRALEAAQEQVRNAYPPAGLYAFGETIVSISGSRDAGPQYTPTIYANGVTRCM